MSVNPIKIDPEILGGTPCFTGTRVPVETLVDYLGRGYTVEYFLAQFPTVRREQIDAVLEGFKREITRVAEVSRA
jgi:uncharacterized protein (DUF433 family)